MSEWLDRPRDRLEEIGGGRLLRWRRLRRDRRLHWDRRLLSGEDFQPSQTLIRQAVERQESVVQ